MGVDAGSIRIRPLTRADLEGALALSSTAGWNQRADDWRMLLELAPHGATAAIAGGSIAGTAIGVTFDGFGWVAMMLVDPACRGQGLGARLLEAALATIPADLPVRLDATPLGRPLYQRHGFVDESVLTRHSAEAPSPDALAAADVPSPVRVRPMTTDDLAAIAADDGMVFGSDRGRLLSWMRGNEPGFAWIADGPGRHAYCLGRHGRTHDQIGPIVAPDHDVARLLLAAALRHGGGRATFVDAYDGRKTFLGGLEACGFTAQRPLYRMCRPGRRPFVPNDGRTSGLTEFAILGPEFG